MKFSNLLLPLFILTFSFLNAQLVDVEIGSNNVPISEIQFEYDNVIFTQTSGATTNTATDKSVLLSYFEINGTTKLYPNISGNITDNNNFQTNVNGVGIYDNGSFISANNASIFEPALEETVNNIDLMQFLYYDGTSNLPSGDDFDIYFAKGIKESDYVSVGERNGNTFFTITPLDQMGNQINGSSKVRFGSVGSAGSGNGTNKYDWDIGFAPTNHTAQSMVFTVIEASLFNIGSETIYGFRIDNNGEADVKFFGLSEDGFEDNPTNPQIGGIAGNVFNDANALVDGTVNGAPISTPSGTMLYANLYHATTGLIIASVPINSDGSFEFLDLEAGSDYAISISTNEGTAGLAVPAQDLPEGWIYTGDYDDTSAGDDGSVDGMQSSLTVNNNMVYNVNYGIEEIPTADPYIFLIEDPAPNSTFVIGSDLTSNLSGDDTEDGALGTSSSFGITSLPTSGNQIIYDGVVITVGEDGINPPSPTNPFIIENYDPTLLELNFNGDPEQSNTSFDYVSIDEAGELSEPVTYTLLYAALPVEWMYFTAEEKETHGILEFATATEIDNSHFLIQKSTDGIVFKTIGKIEGAGYSNEIKKYSFVDRTLAFGLNYYKIVQYDLDGKSSSSEVEVLNYVTDESLRVYPNPVHSNSSITVTFQSGKSNELVTIYNSMGIEVMRVNLESNEGINNQRINLNSLSAGTYILKIGNRSEYSTFIVFE